MTVFVDTSGIFAVLDADDSYHDEADHLWRQLVLETEQLVCTNYVLIETYALVQRRLGMHAARTLEEDVLPLVRVHWVEEADHRSAMAAFLTAGRRDLSLVDCVSFVIMRRLDVKLAFAFDQDFQDQGFEPYVVV